MRLLATADLHHNKPRSRGPAEALAREMLAAGGDALLLVGDTAVSDRTALEEALSLFDDFRGPRLLVAGNHDLWTKRDVSAETLLTDELPRRARAAGWHWLEGEPFELGGTRIVGNIGWYDYSYAIASLEVPEAFYAAKVAPGSARPGEVDAEGPTDVIGRWNDGRFVNLDDDRAFLARRLAALDADLAAGGPVLAAVHHVPDATLLPPMTRRFAFARAYLGSDAIGDVLRRHRVDRVLCGHSHVPARSGGWVNIGSGYREKRFVAVDVT